MTLLLRLALTSLLVPSVSAIANEKADADWKPSKLVTIIVPFAGGTNDVLARIVAQKLQPILGQPVIVESKPGGGGNIGAAYAAKAEPDGHTLLIGYNGPIAINATLFPKLPYNPLDFAPISLAVRAPQYLVVNSNTPFKSVAELVAAAKREPGTLNYASVSQGSASHLTMEMFKSAAKIEISHIPYKGAAPAMTDLIGGTVQTGFFVPGNVQQFVKQGRVRILASTGHKRFPSTPQVPTMIESGYPGFVATSWIGFLAPPRTPKNIVDRYSKEIVKILNEPDVKAKLHEMEFEVVASSPAEFKSWIQSEIGLWGKVINDTGIKPE